MAQLKTYVHVTNPEDGRSVQFGPGQDLPDWAVKAITNPDVWDGDAPKVAGSAAEKTVSTPGADARIAELEAEVKRLREAAQISATGPSSSGDADPIKEPPRGGPGSSAEAWAKFVDEQGVEVPNGATAKDIQALWDDHKARAEKQG